MKFSLSFTSLFLVAVTATTRLAEAVNFFYDNTVECDDNIPEICRGYLYVESTQYVRTKDWLALRGRQLWEYRFVQGLPEGYEVDQWWTEDAQYGPIVEIEVDVLDPTKCTITVENEICNSCEPCGGPGPDYDAFSADCTNLQTHTYIPNIGHGKMVECQPTYPFFYPLEIPKI